MKRKILKKELIEVKFSEKLVLPVVLVYAAHDPIETKRTVKASRVYVFAYINGSTKLTGFSCETNRKAINVNKFDWDHMRRESIQDSFKNYCMTLTNLEGEVRYFDRSSGSGSVYIPLLESSFQVHACNLEGSKSWWPELACVYLEKGPVVIDRLAEVASGVTPIISQGVRFDETQWNEVKKGNHSFTKRDDGSMSGLFKNRTEVA